jgi:carbamoyl-phosphate synthase large subunit
MNLLFSCIGKRGYIADFFRPLLEDGDRIIGTSNTKWTPGFEHCDKNYILPNIDNPNYLPSVLDVCESESISGILSFFDPDVVALSRQFDTFVEMGIIPIIPRQEIAEICFDKYKTYQYLTENNFLTAKTYLDFDIALSDIGSGSLRFPLFVKPRNGFGSALTFKANNTLELDAFFHYAPNMIIQEEMTGEAIDFDILNDFEGNVISVVPWRKYRSRMGETEQAETFYDEGVLNFGFELGSALKHIGPLDADLFMNGSRISVLEVNLRFGGGYPVSHLAGANFPSKIISLIKGENVNPEIGNFNIGTVMMKDNTVIGGLEKDFFKDKYFNYRE